MAKRKSPLCSFVLTSARVNRTSAPFGPQTSFFFFFLSHLQSVQRLNYAKSFSACFKASALIASSPPANTPCQVRPSSEMLANQSKAQTPPSNGCWKLHRGHPDGFRIQSVFPHLPFFSFLFLFTQQKTCHFLSRSPFVDTFICRLAETFGFSALMAVSLHGGL